MNSPKALIAMSGGVDSSVAALFTAQQGFDCIGCMMKLFSNADIGESRKKACCSAKDAQDARSVADRLGMPFYVFNFADAFKANVIDRFVKAYQNGETPNPCIDCNRFMKFDTLLRRADELDTEYIVTGHYARIECHNGRYLLKKAVDASKDQSYVLYTMTQAQLERTLFPLGELHKSRVREIALEHGFVNAEKHDSQDICFVPHGSYADFIRQYTGDKFPKGRFIDTDGNEIGIHKGIIHYTIGQRRGLGLNSLQPLYVCSVCAVNNTVTVGSSDDLYSSALLARDINLISVESIDKPMKVRAKIRYKHEEQPATVYRIAPDTVRAEFDRPQRAVTKGQAVVFYDGDVVVGGGTISEVL